ncbi:hypothetical protein ACVHNB_12740 [Streptomyces sp. YJ-C3]
MRFGAGRAVALAMVWAAAGCGNGIEVPQGLVVERSGPSPAAPYGGPLKASTPSWVGEDSPLEGGGASVRALECAGKPHLAGSRAQGYSDDDSADSAKEALAVSVTRTFGTSLPGRDYRVERRTEDRVLFSYDVGGRTRVAVIVAKDRPHREGWVLETFAQCDPAEFRARDRERLDVRVWEDRRGRPVPTTKVSSSLGPEHCDWQSVEFLHLDAEGDPRGLGRQYFRDPERKLADLDRLTSAYAKDVPLPRDAVDTGYRHDGRQLWLSRDERNAYVRTADGEVERWPGTTESVACK